MASSLILLKVTVSASGLRQRQRCEHDACIRTTGVGPPMRLGNIFVLHCLTGLSQMLTLRWGGHGGFGDLVAK